MSNKNYITTGLHAIEEYLKTGKPGMLYIRRDVPKRISRMIHGAEGSALEITRLSRVELDSLVREKTGSPDNQGCLLISGSKGAKKDTERVKTGTSGSSSGTQNGVGKHKNPPKTLEDFLHTCSRIPEDCAVVILLDGVTDPHNLGAVLRIADQFQIDGVFIPEKRSVKVNQTVSRVSSGADQHVTCIEVTNLVRTIERLKDAGFWIYGADMGGAAIPQVDLARNVALVLGSEGRGISTLAAKRCDQIISIPTQGNIDSLNVSVAAGILSYETRRQQGFPYHINE